MLLKIFNVNKKKKVQKTSITSSMLGLAWARLGELVLQVVY